MHQLDWLRMFDPVWPSGFLCKADTVDSIEDLGLSPVELEVTSCS